MKKNEKGISILLAVLILSILLAIALGISHFVAQQTKMMREVGYSVKSFYAADSGIEEVLYTETIPLGPIMVNGSSYEIFCECCDRDIKPDCPNSNPDCPGNCPPATVDSACVAPNYCVKSIGNHQGYRRAIQVDY